MDSSKPEGIPKLFLGHGKLKGPIINSIRATASNCKLAEEMSDTGESIFSAYIQQ